MDGQAFGAFFAILCGVKDGTDLPGMPTLAWYQWLLIYLVQPFILPVLALKWLCMHRDHNALKTGSISETKKAAATMKLEIGKVKALSKTLGCTVNDVMTSLVVNGMHAYYDET